MGRPRRSPAGAGEAVSVRLPDDLRLYLLAIAMTRKFGTEISPLLREAVEDFVARHRGQSDVEAARNDAIRYGLFGGVLPENPGDVVPMSRTE